MTHSVKLFDLEGRYASPPYWNNFCYWIRVRCHGLVSPDLVNEHLREFNGVFRSDEPNTTLRYLDFKTEQDFSYFVLRWS